MDASFASVQNDVSDPDDDIPLKHLVHNGKRLTNKLSNICMRQYHLIGMCFTANGTLIFFSPLIVTL